LTTLNVSSFDVGNVLDFGGMFVGCTGLTELDLSNFDTHSATRMVSMFAGCENLTKIYASEKWDNSHVTSGDDMFENCYNLKGGQGTVYEQGRTGVTFARID
jgi:surface protein